MKFSPQIHRPLIADRQRLELIVAVILVVTTALLFYMQAAYYLTAIEDSKISVDFPQKFMWWANDSRGYYATGEWLFGRSTETDITIRPWLYPFVLGLTRTIFPAGAEKAIWLLQAFFWAVSLTAIFLAVYLGTKNIALAMLASSIFWTHPTPLVLTFHGMTETLNILLITLFCWLIVTRLQQRYFGAILLFALLTVTKPIYQVPLVLLLVYLFATKMDFRKMRNILISCLCLLPILIQFVLVFIATGKPGFSKIGTNTFRDFYVAVIYSKVEGIDWREAERQVATWNLPQELDYLVAHKRQAILEYRNNVIDHNLWTDSLFVRGQDNRMADTAKAMNAIEAFLHLIMFPIMIYYLLFKSRGQGREVILLLYGTFAIQVLVSGISTGQADRLLITTLPLWIVSYAWVVSNLMTSQPQTVLESE
jgi:hypothetical protein